MSDEELIKEILQGNKAAMEVLVTRYHKLIFSYIYRLTQDYHLSHDLTQESYIKMMRFLPSYRRGSFKAWLFKIATNTCKDYWKSKAAREKPAGEPLEYIQSHEPGVSEIFEHREEYQLIRAALNNLPEIQRTVIILRYYYDLKMKEIAEIMDTSTSTIKSRIHQGIKKLHCSLGGEQFEKERI